MSTAPKDPACLPFAADPFVAEAPPAEPDDPFARAARAAAPAGRSADQLHRELQSRTNPSGE